VESGVTFVTFWTAAFAAKQTRQCPHELRVKCNTKEKTKNGGKTPHPETARTTNRKDYLPSQKKDRIDMQLWKDSIKYLQGKNRAKGKSNLAGRKKRERKRGPAFRS